MFTSSTLRVKHACLWNADKGSAHTTPMDAPVLQSGFCFSLAFCIVSARYNGTGAGGGETTGRGRIQSMFVNVEKSPRLLSSQDLQPGKTPSITIKRMFIKVFQPKRRETQHPTEATTTKQNVYSKKSLSKYQHPYPPRVRLHSRFLCKAF